MPVSKQFCLAGDATFTVSKPDGTHRTYRIQHVPANGRWKPAYFVHLLTGPDNTNDYTYVGVLDDFAGHVQVTRKSPYLQDSGPVKLLNRILARIWGDDHDAYQQHGYATRHAGKCGRCGRKLTTPESTVSGFGPECRKILGIEVDPDETMIDALTTQIETEMAKL